MSFPSATPASPPLPAPPPAAPSDRLLHLLFTLYRHTLSPLFAASHLGHCRYLPSCSEFAVVALSRHGWARGSALALRRLASCHPWSAGGLDPVPPAPTPVPLPPAGSHSSGPASPVHP